MNERIRELAKQAYIKDSLKRNPKWKESEIYRCLMNELDSFFEQFSKLIVDECADFLTDDLDYPDAALKLKQHFGVEK